MSMFRFADDTTFVTYNSINDIIAVGEFLRGSWFMVCIHPEGFVCIATDEYGLVAYPVEPGNVIVRCGSEAAVAPAGTGPDTTFEEGSPSPFAGNLRDVMTSRGD